MSDKPMIIIHGEILIDLALSRNEGDTCYHAIPGGAPANVACALAQWKLQVCFSGPVSRDHLGKELFDTLQARNIDTSLITFVEKPTSLSLISLDENGDRSFSFYWKETSCYRFKNPTLSVHDIFRPLLFHFGSVVMSDVVGRKDTFRIIHKLRQSKRCLISFDPNYREFLWKNEKEAIAAIRKAITYSDVIKLSESELFLISHIPMDSAHTGSDNSLVDRCIEKNKKLFKNKLVFITLGRDGAIAYWKTNAIHINSPDLLPVDTTGAGDCFMAAILHQLIINGGSMTNIDIARIAEWTKHATAAGALATQKRGAINAIPEWDEVIHLKEAQ